MAYFTENDFRQILRWLLLHTVKDTLFSKTDYVTPNDITTLVLNGQNRGISLKDLFNKALTSFDIEELILKGLTIPAESVILSDFGLNLALLLLRHSILYEDLWEKLSDNDKDAKRLYFIVEGNAPIPPELEPEKKTIIWDFSEFTELVVRDTEYRGWTIINNNRSPQDYIDENGIYWSSTSRADARYATYTPSYDGTITVEFTAPKADVVNRIVALGKAIVLNANLEKLLRNNQVVGAETTDGFMLASFTAKVKKGTTYYLYSANGGCHITNIVYQYAIQPVTPPISPTNTYTFKDNTLVGPINFLNNTWIGKFTFEDNTLIINTGTSTTPTPPEPPASTSSSIYIKDGILCSKGSWKDATLIGNFTFNLNTLIL